MKKILLLAALSLFLCNTQYLFSQSVTESTPKITSEERENSLKAGKWALQFTIDQNFTLSNFENSIASVKKQFSDKRALRLGLSLSFSHGKTEHNEFSNLDTMKPENVKSLDYSVFIYPTYLFYVNPHDAINLYFGAGITGGITYSWREHEQDLTSGNYYYDYNRQYSYGGGLTGTVGVEFFPLKNFSIMAEYFASFQYSRSVEKAISKIPGDYHQHDLTNDSFEFFGKRVNFGLSVYF